MNKQGTDEEEDTIQETEAGWGAGGKYGSS